MDADPAADLAVDNTPTNSSTPIATATATATANAGMGDTRHHTIRLESALGLAASVAKIAVPISVVSVRDAVKKALGHDGFDLVAHRGAERISLVSQPSGVSSVCADVVTSALHRTSP